MLGEGSSHCSEGTTCTTHPKTSVIGITVISITLPKPTQSPLYVRASVSRDCPLQTLDLTETKHGF